MPSQEPWGLGLSPHSEAGSLQGVALAMRGERQVPRMLKGRQGGCFLPGESDGRLGGQLRDFLVLFFSYNSFPLGGFFQTHLDTGMSQDLSANKQPVP